MGPESKGRVDVHTNRTGQFVCSVVYFELTGAMCHVGAFETTSATMFASGQRLGQPEVW